MATKETELEIYQEEATVGIKRKKGKMKITFTYIFVLVLLLASSCNENMEGDNARLNDIGVIHARLKDFEFDQGKFSRTVISIGNDGPHYAWAKTDTIGIFPSKGRQVEFSMASGAGSTSATFTGGGWGLKKSSTYAAYCPLIGQYYLDKTQIPVNYSGQDQEGNNSSAHLGADDYLAAPASQLNDGVVSFDFEHLGCLVQIKLTITEPTTIHSITLKTGTNAFATKGIIDLTVPAPQITSDSPVSDITLSTNHLSTTHASQTITLYLMLPPADLSGKIVKVVVDSDSGCKETTLASKNFQAGKAYALSGML